jgi:hypothetical protein
LSGLTASTALALNSSKEVVSVTNTGTGNNVLATSPSIATPTLTGDVQMSTGNLVVGTDGKGIDFAITPGTGTSELLDDYEEGTWTPVVTNAIAGTLTSYDSAGYYTKIGRTVVAFGVIKITNVGTATTGLVFTGYPFASANFAAPAAEGGVALCRENLNTGATGASLINKNAVTGLFILPLATNNVYEWTMVYQTA